MLNINRKEILENLINFTKGIGLLEKLIHSLPWDSEEIILLTNNNVIYVLNLYLEDKINTFELEQWANLIESRDDIGFDLEKTKEIIFELANPVLNGEMTKDYNGLNI